VNSFLIHISFIDALYFSVVTIETIGFGDIYPKSTGGRVWISFYGPLGIVFLYVVVTMTRATVLEAMEIGYRQRMKVVKEKRRAAAQRKRSMSRWRKAVGWRLKRLEVPVWVKDENKRGRLESFVYWVEDTLEKWVGWSLRLVKGKGKDAYHPHHGMRLNLEALSLQQLEAAAMEAGLPLSELLPPNFRLKKPGTQKAGDGENARASTEAGCDLGVNITSEGSVSYGDTPLTHVTVGRMAAMLGRFALAVYTNGIPGPPSQAASVSNGTTKKVNEKVSAEPITSFTRGVGLGSRSSTISMDYRTNSLTMDYRTNTMNSDEIKNGWSLTEAYESYKDNVDQEERKAFVARLMIALTLFLVFWMVRTNFFFFLGKVFM
jgi:potassium channel subfamily K, other eukaryote